VTRRAELPASSGLFRHEARHATQYAWCGGVVMVPLYLVAAGVSWALTGDFGSRNVFERQAGLAGGGYTDKPLRPALAQIKGHNVRARNVSGSARTASVPARP
jgi:hypothetical protein